MNFPRDIPRTGASAQARNWLRANPHVPFEPITIDNADRIRAQIRDAFRAEMVAAREEFPVAETRTAIAGVRCCEFRPALGGERPDVAILYFFGGGFAIGSPTEDVVITAPLAVNLNICVVAPKYSRTPEAAFPVALDEAIAVYRVLIDEYGAENVVVAGESAGGNLALTTTLRARDEGLDLPAGIIGLSPWADLTHSGDSHLADRDPTAKMSTCDLQPLADAYTGVHTPTDPLISPIFADFRGFPPTFLTTGTRDILLSDSVRLATAMRCDGVAVDLRVWEGMWHVFEFYRELPEARTSVTEITAFAANILGVDLLPGFLGQPVDR